MVTRTSMVAGVLLSVQAVPASACGYCVEDRVAATYDFALVSRALDPRHEVVFLGIQGPHLADRMTAEGIARVLAPVGGVDAGSVKVSISAEWLWFTYDPARIGLAPLLAGVDEALARTGLVSTLLRVLDPASYARPAAAVTRR